MRQDLDRSYEAYGGELDRHSRMPSYIGMSLVAVLVIGVAIRVLLAHVA